MANPGLHLIMGCQQCGIEYRQARSDQMYCSSACASRAFNQRRRKTYFLGCAVCGQWILTTNKRTKYCNQECRNEGNRRRSRNGKGKGWSKGKEFVPRRKCIMCSSRFYAPPAQINRGKEYGGCFCSQACYGAFVGKNPERFPMTQSRRGRGGYREDLNRYFRSSWEANYARYLNWLLSIGEIEKWEYEPDTFEFHSIKRGTRFYTPDFKVFSRGDDYEYHEIKGYMDQKSQTAINRMRKYYPDEKLIVIGKDSYYALAHDIQRFIPNWERRR